MCDAINKYSLNEISILRNTFWSNERNRNQLFTVISAEKKNIHFTCKQNVCRFYSKPTNLQFRACCDMNSAAKNTNISVSLEIVRSIRCCFFFALSTSPYFLCTINSVFRWNMHIFTVHTVNFSWDATYSLCAQHTCCMSNTWEKRHIKFNKWHNFYLLYGIWVQLAVSLLSPPAIYTPLDTIAKWVDACEREHEVISIIKFIGRGTKWNKVSKGIFFFSLSLIRSRISYSTQSLHLFKINSCSMCVCVWERFNVASLHKS